MKTVSMQDMVNIIDEKNKIIQEQATEINQLKNRWISVDDRLPELIAELNDEDDPNFQKLISQVVELSDGKRIARGYFIEHFGWFVFDSEIDYFIIKPENITHWQPLPTPPTKENEDD